MEKSIKRTQQKQQEVTPLLLDMLKPLEILALLKDIIYYLIMQIQQLPLDQDLMLKEQIRLLLVVVLTQKEILLMQLDIILILRGKVLMQKVIVPMQKEIPHGHMQLLPIQKDTELLQEESISMCKEDTISTIQIQSQLLLLEMELMKITVPTPILSIGPVMLGILAMSMQDLHLVKTKTMVP